MYCDDCRIYIKRKFKTADGRVAEVVDACGWNLIGWVWNTQEQSDVPFGANWFAPEDEYQRWIETDQNPLAIHDGLDSLNLVELLD